MGRLVEERPVSALHARLLRAIGIRDTSIVPYHEINTALRAVVDLAHEWSLLAPPDDWGDTPQHTERADIGRHLLALIARELGVDGG